MFVGLSYFMLQPPPRPTLFPYTTLFRSARAQPHRLGLRHPQCPPGTTYFVHDQDFHAADTEDGARSEEHTSELQSHSDLVCRLLLEKKKDFKLSGCRQVTIPTSSDEYRL